MSSNSIATTSVSTDLGHGSGGSYPPPAPSPKFEAASQADFDPSDVRLEIEEDKDTGDLVYKTINHATGAVLAQRRDEQVRHLHEEAGYVPGAVIKAKA